MKLLTRIVVWGTVTILVSVLLMGALAVEAHPPLQNPLDHFDWGQYKLQPEPPTGIPWLGIYYGAVSPQNPDGSVLVFVHGYRGVADDWWTTTPYDDLNDMYLLAYQAGYRTAFVNLGGRDGSETGSMWDNGQRLSRQLGVIARHYGVETLDIVAHSKGGLDAQAAVVHYGGWRLVRKVFTLGSPHQGSELADLVYSDWAGWLARLLGLQDDATYTLQTGYMQLFRALTDPKTATQPVTYYRAAGTDTGPTFSGLWLGGLYLSLFGPNDGVVTVASTELPGARILFIGPYHHYNLFLGHTALPSIDAALRGSDGHGPDRHWVHFPLMAVNSTLELPDQRSHSRVILRGGWLSGAVTETVPIESGALNVTFDLVIPNDTVTATLTAPDALPHPMELVPPTGDPVFGRAWHLVYTEDDPVSGEWTFTISSPDSAAYLLVAVLESPLEVTLRGWPEEPMRPGDSLSLTGQAGHPFGYAQYKPAGQPLVQRIEARVIRALPDGPSGTPTLLTANSNAALLQLPSREGIYVISATVTGEMPDGTPFERSFVHSVAVVTSDTLEGGPTLLDR